MRFERQRGKRKRLTFECAGRVAEYTGLQVKGEARRLILDIGELDAMVVILRRLQAEVTDDVCMEPFKRAGRLFALVGKVKP